MVSMTGFDVVTHTKPATELLFKPTPIACALSPNPDKREINREKLAPYLNKEGKISLTNLLNNQGLISGVSNKRFYSGGIDEVLQQYKGANNIYARSETDVFKGLLSVLFLERIDYTMGYPTEVKFLFQRTDRIQEVAFCPHRRESKTGKEDRKHHPVSLIQLTESRHFGTPQLVLFPAGTKLMVCPWNNS